MTALRQHIEQMHLRLTEIASGELALVRALGDALTRVDEKLLREVRQVTAAHEARRGAILGELQALATNIGAFPSPQEPPVALDAALKTNTPVGHWEHGALSALRPGDWRQAAKNIEADLDFVLDVDFNGHGQPPSYGHARAGRDIRFEYS